ncbi:hypothetical protein [Dactylosporangium sp. NPDC049140]|uniref:hypothetical protein n=1 Tax=Dactylosporangium sp. NPDC049140 TaxID=3155647 RepID=UPI0033E5C834
MRHIALLLVPVLLGACAAPGPATPPPDPSASATWTTYQAEVSGVTPGPGDSTVTVEVRALAGREGCSRDVRVTNQQEENGVIFASIVQDSAESATFGACPTFTPVRVTITAKEPIGRRPLTLNEQAWALRGGAYTRCSEDLGCDPPADRCDPVWTRAAVRGLDVSRHSQGSVEACDGTWLVMTVPDDPAACGAEPRPGCTVDTAVRRYFLHNEPAGWTVVAQTTTGGCDAVLRAEPSFPRRLCTDLKPTGRYVTTAPTGPSGAPPGG